MLTKIKHVLHFNSIKGNIIFSMIAMGVFTFMVTVAGYWFSQQMERTNQLLSGQLAPSQQALEALNADVYSATLALNAYLETGKETYRKSWQESWNQRMPEHFSQLRSTSIHTVNKTLSDNINRLSLKISKINSHQQELMDKVQTFYLTGTATSHGATHPAALLEVQQAINATVVPQVGELRHTLELLRQELTIQAQQQQQEQHQKLYLLKLSSALLFILSVIVAVAIAYFLIAQIIRSLYAIKLAVKELSNGNLPEKVRQSQNETSHITKELSKLTHNLRNVQQFALKVGEGQFDNEISVFNNSGDLGSSLACMRDSLSKVAQEDKQRNWVNEGFARFSDIMRSHNNSITELCDNTISSLVKYVGANQGAIFLVRNGGQENEVLQMASCYAYERKKFISKEILKGEGLCGQAWQENDTLLINDVPQNFVQIRSGLGGATPKAILVIPLVAHEQTQGVLELASFQQFEQYQIQFIQRIADNLASAISTAQNSEKTQQLLKEFQIITEQLRAQEEEMRQNMEELESTQEEMHRAQQEISKKEYNLTSVISNTQDTIFAIDQEYRITVVNKVLSDKYKKLGINLEVGMLISSVLPRTAWEKWKPRYDRALAGEQYSIVEESTGTDGSRYSQTYHNPILDAEGYIVGVSVVSRDVTETVVAQQEADRKRSTLNSIIDYTDDTYFAIDKNYKILIANKTLKDRYAASNITLEEGENIFDKLPKDQHPMWKERYDRALTGESFVLTTERQVKEKTLTIEVHHHPILDAEGNVIGATVISKDITRWQKAILEKEVHEKEFLKLKKLVGLESSAKAQVLNRVSEKRINH